ncbi:MAG: SusD/RagB family nutrient-binding outer membrane lipoprotein [Cyclobacteriaceae bacterium]|nr:SusD/RagB family nutrient-binding outer membrane lipoprotein [Cyclobacteriaceae bacterium]
MRTINLKTIVVICLTILPFSCTKDFEELNNNPNVPESVDNPGLLLTDVIRGSMDNLYTGAWRRGNIVADYMANQFVSAFDWAPADASEFFLWSFYDYLRGVYTINEIAENKALKNYQGISLVLKSFMFQSMTDIYGAIPYSEAIKAKSEGINFPGYDSQEEIYNGILADLEKANELLGAGDEAVVGDILYGGDMMKWKKFANSLRLRCLLRLELRRDPTAEMKKMLSDPGKYPLFSSHDEQAALQYVVEFPRYRVLNFASSTRASTSLVERLSAIKDPRLYVYAQPTPASVGSNSPVYKGVPNGIENPDLVNGGSLNQSPPGMLWASLAWSAEFASPTAAQTLLMTHAELQFILAEAAQKGYIEGGETAAEQYYSSGMKSSFSYYASRIPDNYTWPKASDVIPDPSYYTQGAVSYVGSHEEKLAKIALQKWISLFNCGFEAWSEWRRTGMPEIVPGPTTLGFVPVRFYYPLTEQSFNNNNYAKALEQQGPDYLTTQVWWDAN